MRFLLFSSSFSTFFQVTTLLLLMQRAGQKLAFIVVLIVSLSSCDKGLQPTSEALPPPETGAFAGLITFQNWQLADSLYDIRLVAFRVFPPGDIVNEVLQGRAVIYPSIGGDQLVTRNTDSLRYTVVVPAATYPYVAVAQQFGPDVFMDWRPVGQYVVDTLLSQPSPVIVQVDDTLRSIDIHVDFANLPPPPLR
jgi:hypothetical protein